MDVFFAVEGMLRTPVGVPFLATETFPPFPSPSAAVVTVYLKLPIVKVEPTDCAKEGSVKNNKRKAKTKFLVKTLIGESFVTN